MTGDEFHFDGDQIAVRLRALATLRRKQAARGLLMGAEYLLAETIPYVPIEEGTLQRSGVATVDPGQLEAAVAFDTPYAVRQHEELDYHHDPGREAKFLENRMNSPAVRAGIRRVIANEMKKGR